jgi:hypothetical protein
VPYFLVENNFHFYGNYGGLNTSSSHMNPA